MATEKIFMETNIKKHTLWNLLANTDQLCQFKSQDHSVFNNQNVDETQETIENFTHNCSNLHLYNNYWWRSLLAWFLLSYS